MSFFAYLAFDQKLVAILFVELHLYFCYTLRRKATQSQHFCNNVKERWRNAFSLNKIRRKPNVFHRYSVVLNVSLFRT